MPSIPPTTRNSAKAQPAVCARADLFGGHGNAHRPKWAGPTLMGSRRTIAQGGQLVGGPTSARALKPASSPLAIPQSRHKAPPSSFEIAKARPQIASPVNAAATPATKPSSPQHRAHKKTPPRISQCPVRMISPSLLGNVARPKGIDPVMRALVVARPSRAASTPFRQTACWFSSARRAKRSQRRHKTVDESGRTG